ncbi:MAG: 6,7-dimethyl-8-ribityllumazine synthase [Acidobacteria bacterium]|nr:6,7-dimethyl-8-ribityllumazine synthase [Acidobacteriota bacterium]MBE3135330.1 6,7-dimethyl-8-ribityllumazine synthase [Acidobacteriota bacterium]
MGTTYQGRFDGRGRRLALVVSRFNDFITRELVAGARDGLLRHGAADADIDVIWVPGSFELPMAAQRLARSRRYGAIVCLGCLIQGDTPHFQYIASEVTKGVAQVGLEHGTPVVFGVITADTLEQAIERAGTKAGNKGFDAALTALELIDLYAQIDADLPAPGVSV